MRIEKNKNKISCELGSCRNLAEYIIRFEGLGAACGINICEKCMHDLNYMIRQTLKKNREIQESLPVAGEVFEVVDND